MDNKIDFRGDGSYMGRQSLEKESLLTQMRQLNKELKARYGSKGICTIGVTPSTKNPSSFVLVMPQQGERKQERVPLMKKGHNAAFSLGGLNVAYGLASEVCTKLRDGTFTYEWLDSFLNKNLQEPQKTIGQWVEEFMEWWWKTPIKRNGKQTTKSKKDPRYTHAADFLIETFSVLPQDRPFTKAAIETALKQFPDNQIGRNKVDTLNRLLNFVGIYEYKALTARKREQATAGIQGRDTYVPTDDEIVETYCEGYSLVKRDGKRKGGFEVEGTLRQRWLFGLLATYGIRIHEAWMVMNWTNSIEIKAGEFIEIDEDVGGEEYAIGSTQTRQRKIIPAFFAPNNEQPLLVIRGGKTGKRIAMPLSPKDQDWVDLFDLRNHADAYLPNYKDPLKLVNIGNGCSEYQGTDLTCLYFRRSIRWDLLSSSRFTAHKLRHAFTHRGRLMGINHSVLALSQGHTEETASGVYAKHFADDRTLEAIQLAQEEMANHQNTLLPPIEVAIARASYLAGSDPDKQEFASRLLGFMYGMPHEEIPIR